MNENFYNNEYMSKMHKIGKVTGIIAVACSFLPAIVLGLVYGLWPDLPALGTAFVTATASFGFLWVIEPISYYPVVGPVGTYMAFVSGNISNMRIPCASMAQVATGIEPGTEKGSIIATIGMGVSVIVNVAILSIGVIAGSSVLAMLPAEVTAALNYLLPALFGALFIQFALKNIKLGVIMTVFGVIVNYLIAAGVFSFIPGASNYLGTLLCVFGSIFIGLQLNKKKA